MVYTDNINQLRMERHNLNYMLARELLGQEKGLLRQEQKSLLMKAEKNRTTEDNSDGAKPQVRGKEGLEHRCSQESGDGTD